MSSSIIPSSQVKELNCRKGNYYKPRDSAGKWPDWNRTQAVLRVSEWEISCSSMKSLFWFGPSIMEVPRHLERWHSYTYGGSIVQNLSQHISQLKSLGGVFKITNARKSSSTEDEFDF